MKNWYLNAAFGMGCVLPALHASAQTSGLTLYGLIDLCVVKESGSGWKLSPGYNNWLGVKGEEALGDGLSAMFDLETRFTPDTGGLETGVFLQGESTVGLKKAGIGSFRLGRAETPLWQQKWIFEPWWASGVNGSLGSFQTGSYSSDPTFALNFANYARVPNAVFVDSDVFDGFSLHYSGQVERDEPGAARNEGVGIKYAHGELAALIAYEKNRADDKITFVAASYKLGAATLMGSASAVKLAGASFTEKNYVIAGNYTFGQETIRAGYGNTSNEIQDRSKVTAGFSHALSKRTSVYFDLYRNKAATSSSGTALGIDLSF